MLLLLFLTTFSSLESKSQNEFSPVDPNSLCQAVRKLIWTNVSTKLALETGKKAHSEKRFDTARQQFEFALKMDPTSFLEIIEMANDHFAEHYSQGGSEAAGKEMTQYIYDIIMKFPPRTGCDYYTAGRFFRYRNETQEALKYLKAACEIDTSGQYGYELTKFLFEQKDYESAIVEGEKYVNISEKDQENWDIWDNFSHVSMILAEIYTEHIPDDHKAYSYAKRSFRLEKARVATQLAYGISEVEGPFFGSCHVCLGSCYEKRLGKYKEAYKQYKKATETEGALPDA